MTRSACLASLSVAALLAIAAGSAFAQDSPIDRCTELESDTERLACFDSLAATTEQGALDPGERRGGQALGTAGGSYVLQTPQRGTGHARSLTATIRSTWTPRRTAPSSAH